MRDRPGGFFRPWEGRQGSVHRPENSIHRPNLVGVPCHGFRAVNARGRIIAGGQDPQEAFSLGPYAPGGQTHGHDFRNFRHGGPQIITRQNQFRHIFPHAFHRIFRTGGKGHVLFDPRCETPGIHGPFFKFRRFPVLVGALDGADGHILVMIPVQGAAWQVVRYRLGDQAHLLVGADIGGVRPP